MTPESEQFPLKQDTVIELTLAAIDAQRCTLVPSVTLVSGTTDDRCDSVRYVLSPEAARKYAFDANKPLDDAADDAPVRNLKSVLKVASRGHELEIRLKPGSSKKQPPVNLVFNLVLVSDGKTAVRFDPLVGSGGGPRK